MKNKSSYEPDSAGRRPELRKYLIHLTRCDLYQISKIIPLVHLKLIYKNNRELTLKF